MKIVFPLLASALLISVAGCQTSTHESRRAQVSSTYPNVPRPGQQLGNQEAVVPGMNPEGVLSLWGVPSKQSTLETPRGEITTWQYFGNTVLKRPYWEYRYDRYGRGTLDHRMEHFSTAYLQREVVFQNDQVVRAEEFPRPQWTHSRTLLPRQTSAVRWPRFGPAW